MKKILALVLALVMVFAFTACKSEETPDTPDVPADSDTVGEGEDNTDAEAEVEYKLGMGVYVNTKSSATGNAQVDATVAAVILDKSGKIVACRLDVAQNKMDITDGAVDTAKVFETKMELGEEYGMANKIDNNADGVMNEWCLQAEAFECFASGKTADEIKNMKTQTLESGYVIPAEDELLSAGCTIDVVDFIEAVVMACNDEQAMTFTAPDVMKFGLAATTTAKDSVAATAEENGTVAMYSDFAATVLDFDGKIVAALNDAIQPKIAINAAGEIVEISYTATKRNLKEDYNMATYGASMDNNGDGKVLEWYVQSEAFSKFVIGKTGTEVGAMQTQTLENGYKISADEALLSAGCTIQITEIANVVAQSTVYAD